MNRCSKHLFRLPKFLLLVLILSICKSGATQSFDKPDRYRLIKLSAPSVIHAMRGIESNIIKKSFQPGHPASGLYKIPYDELTVEELQLLLKRGDIQYYENDAVGYGNGIAQVDDPNDPQFSKQWYLKNDGTFNLFGIPPKAGADINISDAWQLQRGDSTLIVAILDTGINTNHREFDNRLWKNSGETAGNQIDDDKNGYIDDMNGWDFVNDRASVADDNGHGTALAGVIAADVDNNFAYSGINQHCRLMICKVLGANQQGFYSDWIAGIYYAVEHGADIINMSVSGETDLQSLHDAILYAFEKGVLVVCSMGNFNTDLSYYPAGYAETLAVGSTDANDKRSIAFSGGSGGSNFGPAIDLVAPGNGIYGLDRSSNSVNTIWSGTSMSAAMVTGAASLLLSAKPSLSPNELKGLLLTTAADQVGRPHEDIAGWDFYHGFGRVDAFEALKGLQNYDEAENPFQLSVYPNPATGYVSVSVLLTSLEAVQLQIWDELGKNQSLINITPLTPDLNYSLDLSHLNPGIYIFMLRQGNKLFRFKLARY